MSANELESRLRLGEPRVIARIKDGPPAARPAHAHRVRGARGRRGAARAAAVAGAIGPPWPRPSLVLGTAGHIDHGKSALVKALTGTDPDRLPEEKERGVTIELGFARLELPSGRAMGVVDVPGHERFVRQMVAGATGIDVVLLVVAADDGVMPQTREHLAIIDLLGIPRGVVAITKADLADAGLDRAGARRTSSALLARHVASRARRSCRSPRGPGAGSTSCGPRSTAVAGRGARAAGDPADAPAGRPRLHHRGRRHGRDRHAVVGAATARRPGRALPVGRARPRPRRAGALAAAWSEAQRRPARRAQHRGPRQSTRSRAATSSPRPARSPSPTASTRGSPTSPATRSRSSPARACTCTTARARCSAACCSWTREALRPGERGFAQVRLEEPLAPRYDDRFIVRSYSPVYTIGGGVVLDALPPRRTTLKPHERELLEALAGARPVRRGRRPARVARRPDDVGRGRRRARRAARRRSPTSSTARSSSALKVGGETASWHAEATRDAGGRHRARRCSRFHEDEPQGDRHGDRARCATGSTGGVAPKVFDAVLELAVERGVARSTEGAVRHPQGRRRPPWPTRRRRRRAAAAARRRRASRPDRRRAGRAGRRGRRRRAQGARRSWPRAGAVVRLGPELHFAAAAVERRARRIVATSDATATMLAKDARDVTGVVAQVRGAAAGVLRRAGRHQARRRRADAQGFLGELGSRPYSVVVALVRAVGAVAARARCAPVPVGVALGAGEAAVGVLARAGVPGSSRTRTCASGGMRRSCCRSGWTVCGGTTCSGTMTGGCTPTRIRSACGSSRMRRRSACARMSDTWYTTSSTCARHGPVSISSRSGGIPHSASRSGLAVRCGSPCTRASTCGGPWPARMRLPGRDTGCTAPRTPGDRSRGTTGTTSSADGRTPRTCRSWGGTRCRRPAGASPVRCGTRYTTSGRDARRPTGRWASGR